MSRRLHEFDFLRGCMLLMMTLDHLLWSSFTSLGSVSDITYEFFGAVSSADGFVFLSGMVAGLVYGKTALNNRMNEVRQRIFERVKQLYLINVACIVALVLGAVLLGSRDTGITSNPYHAHPLVTVLFGALHLSLPSFLDILPIYCYFLLLLVPLLNNLVRGRIVLVISVSVGGWVIGQFGPFQLAEKMLNQRFTPSVPFNLGFFDAFSWQLLFVIGASLGFAYVANKLPKVITSTSRLIFIISFVITVILFLMRHHLISIAPLSIDPLIEVRTLGVLRLIGLTCLGYVLLVIIRRWSWLVSWRPLVFLGQHSLYVYAYHTLLCYGLLAWITPRLDDIGRPFQVIALFCSLGSLWIPAVLHHQWLNRKLFLIRILKK